MSLRSRLAVFLALAIVVAVVAQAVLGFLEFRRVLYQDLDRDLEGFLGVVAGRIESLDGLERLDSSYENYVTRARVMNGDRVLITLGGRFPESNGGVGRAPSSNGGWRFASLALPGLGANLRLEGAINAQSYENSLASYRRTATLTALAFSGLGLLLALVISTQALRPLHRLLEVTQRVAASGDLTLRVPSAGAGELARLSHGFNRMLERLQASRRRESEFTRHASHELRTPLTAIGLEIGSYREGLTGAEDALIAIEREARRMKRLSEALLILAREGRPQMQPLDLGQLGRACAERGGAPFLGLAHLEIQGNAPLIERALENLLENAAKYAPDTAITVELARDQQRALLTVTDQGPGMGAEALEHATDTFYRASGTLEPGSGVGLSVVERVMEAHGGQVRLENIRPHGLRVTLAFPITDTTETPL